MGSKAAEKTQASQESLSYVSAPNVDLRPPENFREKFIRKTKENPLVPIGLLATVAILVNGVRSMTKGDRQMSQKMMRARVVAQGFTVAALVGGIMWSTMKKDKPKE